MLTTNRELVEHLERAGMLKSALVKKAIVEVDRKRFVLEEFSQDAYFDGALPLTDGQTISQPTTIVFMLELLDVRKGNKTLDIGAGSGWVACLMANIAGEKGKVYAYEINENVGKLGKENVRKNGIKNIEYFIADATEEWQKNAPYDRIYAGAAFKEITKELLNQLTVGGILVAPTQSGYIEKYSRKSEKEFEKEGYYGFVFVPFVER